MNREELDLEMDAKMRELLNAWADQGQLSPDRSRELKKIVHRQALLETRYRWLRNGFGSVAVAVVLLTMAIMIFPGVRIWAAENIPVVGQYIAAWSEIEKGWEWAEEHDMFQEVLASTTDQGYTLRVHRVLADDTQTTLIYTVEGVDPGRVNLGPREILFNGKQFIRGMGGRGEVIDGVLVESVEFNPLPAESGKLELRVSQIGDVEGNWHVSFPVTRAPLSGLTQTVSINKSLAVPGGVLTVEDMQLAPTQTVVRLSYEGQGPAPDLGRGVSLFLQGEPLEPRGASGSGSLQEDGSWQQNYLMEFQRTELPSPGSQVTIKLGGRVHRQGETRLPLEEGRTAFTPHGQEVRLEKVKGTDGQGQAAVSYFIDKQNPQLFEDHHWQVIDEEGAVHPCNLAQLSTRVTSEARPISPGEDEQISQEAQIQLEWQLPSGGVAVALVNPGYWTFEELGTVTVEIPAK